MFDVLNEQLIHEGKEPIAFDHDCREGICGMCFHVYQWPSARLAGNYLPVAYAFLKMAIPSRQTWRAQLFLW